MAFVLEKYVQSFKVNQDLKFRGFLNKLSVDDPKIALLLSSTNISNSN